MGSLSMVFVWGLALAVMFGGCTGFTFGAFNWGFRGVPNWV